MTRTARIGAGLGAALLLGLVWLAPLGDWMGTADSQMAGGFPAHMLRHMTLVALAAPLLVLALPGAARWLSVAPLAGAVLEFLIVWAWHLPALHALARTNAGWLVLEQAMFLGAGLAVWAGAIAGGHPLAGAGSLLLTSMHMTLLGALFILARVPLYGGDLAAQQLGGMLMLGIGTPVYLLGGLWLSARALLPDQPQASDAGRALMGNER